MSENTNTAPTVETRATTPRKFHNLSIAVIVPRDDHGDDLIREVQKTRAKVQHIWPMPEKIPTDFDIVFCQLVDDLPSRFQGIPGSVHVTLVAVIPAHGTLNHKVLENSVPHAAIHLPCRAEEVLSSMIVARSHYQYERRLRQRIEKLDDNLRSMKTIERAKVIMMQSKNLNEEEAYKQLRLRAMQRRVSIGSLASSIVDSQELLG